MANFGDKNGLFYDENLGSTRVKERTDDARRNGDFAELSYWGYGIV